MLQDLPMCLTSDKQAMLTIKLENPNDQQCQIMAIQLVYILAASHREFSGNLEAYRAECWTTTPPHIPHPTAHMRIGIA